jgi:DNA polymerase I-like protein with 3'-5' exonuclease and polymerase domains
VDIAPNYGLVTSDDELELLFKKLVSDGVPVGYDIETGYEGETREDAQLHPEENFIAGLSLTNDLTWARYLPLRHYSGVNLDNGRVAELLWEIAQLRDNDGLPLIVSHGAIFEKRCSARFFLEHLGDHPVYGQQVRDLRGYIPIRSDTMLESYVEAKNVSHALKFITLQTFGHKMTEIMELFPEGLTKFEQNSIRFSSLDQHDPKVYSYACEDALWCLAHHRKRFPVLRYHPIYKLEMALLEEVLPDCADTGVYYDWALMRDASRKAHEFLPLYEAEVRLLFEEETGHVCDINFASPKQMQKLLYDDMELPVIKRTPKGAPSTNAKEVLVNFIQGHPAIDAFVKWKELQTLCNNFLDTYEQKYSYAPDGRAHPSLLQHGTVSGRFAHADPNYAQTSKKKYRLVTRDGAEFKFELRRAIAAPLEWYILGFDYSMVELRVVAGEADEPALLEAFRAGLDVHRKTATLMTGKSWDDIDADDRQVGKTSNFSLGYGQAAKALAERLGCSVTRAEELYGIYHSSYPNLNRKRAEVIAQARRDGYVITKFGRKVPLPEIFSSNRKLRDDAERTAGNVFVQGPGSGDYPKIAMVRAVRVLKAAGLQDSVKLVMNIHDALEFYVRKDVPPASVIRVLKDAVVFPVPGWPPIVADWHMGLNWADLVELEVTDSGEVHPKKKGLAVHSVPAPEGTSPAPEPQVIQVPVVPGPSAEVTSRPESPRRLLVETDHIPHVDDARSLLVYLRARPGPHTVVLVTPQGDVELPGTSGLDLSHEPDISVMLKGARIRYDESSVDMGVLGAGISL